MSAVMKQVTGWVVLALALVIGGGIAVLYALDPASRTEAVKSAVQFVAPVLSALVAAVAASFAGMAHKATKDQNATLDTIEGKVNGGLDTRLAAQSDAIVERVVTQLAGAQLAPVRPRDLTPAPEAPSFPDMPPEVYPSVQG